VVRPAETILEVVPQDDRLIFNGAVQPGDIDRVRVGQPVRVRLSAFNQATTPELEGRVIFVSANPASDAETGLRFFRVRVALVRSAQQTAAGLPLVSGMPAELLIETGSRSMLSFVTKPLIDQFARAFRN
jgi:HlyD family secretion protein